jgi:hypothetical protein
VFGELAETDSDDEEMVTTMLEEEADVVQVPLAEVGSQALVSCLFRYAS